MNHTGGDFAGITRVALEALERPLLFPKFMAPVTPLSKREVFMRRAKRYFHNLGGAWLGAIRALAGKNPHEHCDEDY